MSSLIFFFRLKFLLDFLLLIVPVLLSFTILCDHLDASYAVLLSLIVTCLLYSIIQTPAEHRSGLSINNVWDTALPGKRPFITNFRAYVNVATAISILAVDFTIFPRRYGQYHFFLWHDYFAYFVWTFMLYLACPPDLNNMSSRVLSPPAHFAWWVHVHHFLSIRLSMWTLPKIRLDNNSYHGKY